MDDSEDEKLADLRVLFLSASLSRDAGGIFEIELGLAKHLTQKSVQIVAQGLRDEGWQEDSKRWKDIRAQTHPTVGPKAFGYSPSLASSVRSIQADILHLHTLWMYPSCLANSWKNTFDRPYVVTPNGMLEPWALSNSSLKKRIASFFYEKRMLAGAACLQANTRKEADDFRNFGLHNPIAIIPNGVDLPDHESSKPEKEGRSKTLLFLGRLHPKKGLVNLLRAWALHLHSDDRASEPHDWQLVIAGWDQGGHEAELKAICAQLGIRHASVPVGEFLTEGPQCHNSIGSSTVAFVGPAFGEQKISLLSQADAFVLPSFSEGLPMSILEAWSYGLPVLMTDHCNLPVGFSREAAIRIETDPDSIAAGLDVLTNATVDERCAMGASGRQLVEEQFTWQQVAEQMKAVYEWVLGRREIPDCVEPSLRS